MGLREVLESEIDNIIRYEQWTYTDGRSLPQTKDIGLGNKGIKIKATVLYADLAESTSLVDSHRAGFAAEVYKSYLLCAVKIIRSNGGKIASFDGDRVMGVFHGDNKNTDATQSAMMIAAAVANIINPTLKDHYGKKGLQYQIKAACGVDTSELLVARTGIRNNNDLVWIGRAANHAAKMCAFRQEGYQTWITEDVYRVIEKYVKFHNGRNMWEQCTWKKYNRLVYRTKYVWSF